LHQVHGLSEIEPWFAETLRPDTAGTGSRFKNPTDVAGLLGIEFSTYRGPGRDRYFSVFIDPQTPLSISGYDHMVRATYSGMVAKGNPAKHPVTSQIETAADSVVVKFVTDSTSGDSAVIPLRPLIDRVVSAHVNARGLPIPGDEAIFAYETAGFKTMVVLLQAHFQRQDSTIVVDSYDALIFYAPTSED
jgi:hypothetical protein